MALDLRPAFGLMVDAFGLPVVVTRPAPDDTPIETNGIWVAPVTDSVPFGTDFQRRDVRRVIAISRADVPALPHGSKLVAAEQLGDTPRTWKVDGVERLEPDHIRVVVVAC